MNSNREHLRAQIENPQVPVAGYLQIEGFTKSRTVSSPLPAEGRIVLTRCEDLRHKKKLITNSI